MIIKHRFLFNGFDFDFLLWSTMFVFHTPSQHSIPTYFLFKYVHIKSRLTFTGDTKSFKNGVHHSRKTRSTIWLHKASPVSGLFVLWPSSHHALVHNCKWYPFIHPAYTLHTPFIHPSFQSKGSTINLYSANPGTQYFCDPKITHLLTCDSSDVLKSISHLYHPTGFLIKYIPQNNPISSELRSHPLCLYFQPQTHGGSNPALSFGSSSWIICTSCTSFESS